MPEESKDQRSVVTVAGVDFIDLGDGWFQCGDIVSRYDSGTLWVVNLADFRPPFRPDISTLNG